MHVSTADRTKKQWMALAAQAEEEGDHAGAEQALLRARAMDAGDDIIVIRLFRVLMNLGRPEAAQALAEARLAAGPVPPRLATQYILSDFQSYAVAHCLPDVQAKLALYPRGFAIRARASLAYAWHGQVETALSHARAAIAGSGTVETADMVRSALARRIFYLGHVEAADRICRMGRLGVGREADILYERLTTRTRNAANDDTTRRLFRRLLAMDDLPRRAAVVAQHVDFHWRLDGPSSDLLAEIEAQLGVGGDARDGRLHLMKIALAMQLGERDVALATLRARPDLWKKASACLPVAKLVHDHDLGGGGSDADVIAYAGLFDALCRSEDVLRERLGDPARSCAVVGNSSCEMGRGNGARIDAHGDVVRFNRFRTDPPFDRDYGAKTTVLVRAGNDRPEIGVNIPPRTLILISSGSIAYRGRAWQASRRLQEQGHILTVFPPLFHAELSRKLVASPSSGLSFVYLMKALRGTLRRQDYFGFAFVDQIGEQAKSAHYFEQVKPSTMHKWDKELEMFDSLFAGEDAVRG